MASSHKRRSHTTTKMTKVVSPPSANFTGINSQAIEYASREFLRAALFHVADQIDGTRRPRKCSRHAVWWPSVIMARAE